jgi:hypothetical protein
MHGIYTYLDIELDDGNLAEWWHDDRYNDGGVEWT